MNFFIASLPRSRTLWWNKYYEAYGVTCHHELSSNITSVEEFKEKMGTDCGTADWHIVNTPAMSMYPDARTAVILREPEEVMQSLVKNAKWPYAITYMVIAALYEKLVALTGPNVKHFEYDNINKDLEEIHNWLTPNIPFNEEIANTLIDTKVNEQMSTYYADKFTASTYVWRRSQPDKYDTEGRLR